MNAYRQPKKNAAFAWLAASLCLMAACLDFEPFDPRLAEDDDTAAGSGGSPASSGSAMGGASTSAAGGGQSSSGSGGAGLDCTQSNAPDQGVAGAGPISYLPTVADCLDIGVTPLSPSDCEEQSGFGTMKIDLDSPEIGYLRFDLDDRFMGKTITAVTLRMTVTDGSDADSDDSGFIQQTACFIYEDLFVAAPEAMPPTLAPSQADPGKGAVVDFSLPTNVVQPRTALTLALLPNSGNNVVYHNGNGQAPPELIIDFQ